MSNLPIAPTLPQAAVPTASRKDTPAKIHAAAQQFEALLIGQILQSANPAGGWMGSEENNAAGSSATGFALEQLASMMAKSGGFGLAHLIETGLERTK